MVDEAATRDELETRLERERKARLELESVAEKATRELYLALQEAKSANQSLRDFVAIASHDLRAPISAIVGFAQTLTKKWASLDEDQRLEFIGIIDRAGHQLAGLVDDLLTVSRIEAGALDVQREVVALRNAAARAMENFVDHSGDVEIHIDDGTSVEADPEHLQRILVNYLSNGIKYGSPPIEVQTVASNGWVEIKVIDHGEGVPEAFVPRLFQKFSRADSETARQQRGTGLGLAIVKGLANANGGDARYEPNEPKGACFVVRLPGAHAATSDKS